MGSDSRIVRNLGWTPRLVPSDPHCCLPVQVTQSLGVPRAYVRMLCELEDFMAKTLAGALGGGPPPHRCACGDNSRCAVRLSFAARICGAWTSRVHAQLLCPPPTTLAAGQRALLPCLMLRCPAHLPSPPRRKAQAEPHQHAGAHSHEADAAQAQHRLCGADAHFQVRSWRQQQPRSRRGLPDPLSLCCCRGAPTGRTQ